MTVEYMFCTDVIKTKTHVLKIQDKSLKYGSKVPQVITQHAFLPLLYADQLQLIHCHGNSFNPPAADLNVSICVRS